MPTAAGAPRAGGTTDATGVTVDETGGTLRIYSHHAEALELCVFDARDPMWIVATVPMTRGADGVWTAHSPLLVGGARYAVRASGPSGPRHSFDPTTLLVDPYARGLVEVGSDRWRSVVVDDRFDWGGVERPRTPLDRTVIYEAHVRGLTRLAPGVPQQLRGTYAGLAHPATIDYLTTLGVTAVELLPVQAFVSEQRLVRQGLRNYWGYNTLGFFAPHSPYATNLARALGPHEVLREFKGMVRLLHQAGIEVILDVVYNHTAEEGVDGPWYHLRGLDNASYYRQTASGAYIDETGCGNTLDFSQEAAQRLTLDSLRYWADEVQVDGFRFDLAVTLGRGGGGGFETDSPFLADVVDDPSLAGLKLIAEPWDVGMGGWQTGNFARGWSEWNDRYRDRVRNFWLRDIAEARRHGEPPTGVGGFAGRLSGSSSTFPADRGPLAGVDFVTAHDGFTLADLVSYDVKHNVGNGESNRDGSDSNRSYNFGVEGPTGDPVIRADRRRAARNLFGTLLLSAGIPMITAGDEVGRSQSGNNNAYCHDDELTWMSWTWDEPRRALRETVVHLLRLRRENPALRPSRFGRLGEEVPSATRMDWFDATGSTMDDEDWQNPRSRTLQYLAASTPETEAPNRVLLVVHGLETEVEVTLPDDPRVGRYVPLWDSADERPVEGGDAIAPGAAITIGPTSLRLFRAEDAG